MQPISVLVFNQDHHMTCPHCWNDIFYIERTIGNAFVIQCAICRHTFNYESNRSIKELPSYHVNSPHSSPIQENNDNPQNLPISEKSKRRKVISDGIKGYLDQRKSLRKAT